MFFPHFSHKNSVYSWHIAHTLSLSLVLTTLLTGCSIFGESTTPSAPATPDISSNDILINASTTAETTSDIQEILQKRNSVQEELMTYINEDYIALTNAQKEMLDDYHSVSGDNFIDNATLYNELRLNTLTLCILLNDQAVAINSHLKQAEILQLHAIYLQYVNEYLNAFNCLIYGFEMSDPVSLNAAEEKIANAEQLMKEFQSGLSELKQKYHINTTSIE